MDRERNGCGKGVMEMCGLMMTKFMGGSGASRFGHPLMIPGLLLILGGVLIFAAPMVLVWLIAGGAIVIGLLIILAPILIRNAIARRNGTGNASQMPIGRTSGSAG